MGHAYEEVVWHIAGEKQADAAAAMFVANQALEHKGYVKPNP